jgi:ubiquinone/menaquinone biosynthesis C-methylase UbiE
VTAANPFLDQGRRHELYGDAARLARRSGALLQAKTAGRPVPEHIAELTARHQPGPGQRIDLVADIGCGRGTSSRVLAERLRPRRLLCIDAAPALLADARARTDAAPGVQAGFLGADFHRLPLPGSSCTLAVAAFCLYHSPTPAQAVQEIARVLTPGGLAVLVTKSLDSYREMDALVAAAGLDPRAGDRASLYASAHSGNLADLARPVMEVIEVEHEEHTFTFGELGHAAAYLSTSPKYRLPRGLYGNPAALAAALRTRHPDRPVTTSSVVTYVVARRCGGQR